MVWLFPYFNLRSFYHSQVLWRIFSLYYSFPLVEEHQVLNIELLQTSLVEIFNNPFKVAAELFANRNFEPKSPTLMVNLN